jgi:hypothetical protein
MATLDSKREVAAAFLEGRKPKRRLDNMPIGITGSILYSYGPHWILASHGYGDDIWTNPEDYVIPETGKVSTVTRSQKRALEWELEAHGYRRDERYDAHGWQLWTKGGG